MGPPEGGGSPDPAGPPVHGPPVGWPAGSGAVAHVVLEDGSDTGLEARLTLDGPSGHHLARVRRLRPGEAVSVADGRGSWRLYEIAAAGSSGVSLHAVGETVREPSLVPALAVAFGLAKGSKPDLVARGLTELGVDRIVPLVTRRSVPRWDDRKRVASTERLRRIAKEAAEQSRRARLPVIVEPVGLDELAGTPGLVVAVPGLPDTGDADPQEPPRPGATPRGDDATWTLVVGPEGGLDPEEVARLEDAGPVGRVSVGPFVLRTETAVLAVAAVLTARRRPARPTS